MGEARGEGGQGVITKSLAQSARKDMRRRPNLREFAAKNPDLWKPASSFYDLKDELAFDELTNLLSGWACRDQEEPVERGPSLEERRAGIFRAAHALKRQAALMRQTYDQMQEDFTDLHGLLQYHAPLMEAVFDIETGPPDNLFLPEELKILYAFDIEVDEEKLREWLQAVERIPVRAKLKRGPVENSIVRYSVAACRDYWIDAEHRSWTMYSLKTKAVRDENNRDHLQGECEAFVADLLDVCGIRFTLAELATAWTAVDKDALAAGGQAPGIAKRKLMLGGDS